MNKIKCKGIIIDKREYGEADVYLDVFTETLGRVSLYVRGIRKTKNRHIGAMDILACSEMHIIEKKGEYILSHFELLEPFSCIKESLEKIGTATYLLDVIKKINYTTEKKDIEFKLFFNSLKYIEKTTNTKEQLVLVAYFLFKTIYYEGIMFSTIDELIQQDTLQWKEDMFQDAEQYLLEKIIKNIPKEIDYEVIKEKNIIGLIYILEAYINSNLDINLSIESILKNYFLN